MAHCWTCGSDRQCVFSCTECKGLKELHYFHNKLVAFQTKSSLQFDDFISELSATIMKTSQVTQDELERIATGLEWLAEDIHSGFRYLAEILSNPILTKAQEQVRIAITCEQNGDLVSARRFYETAIGEYPIVFPWYIGLAKICLRQNDFTKADNILYQGRFHTKSDLDESQRLRLRGRISYCLGDYEQAYKFLSFAVKPTTFPIIAYDFAQYAALTGRPKTMMTYLEGAVERKPKCWHLTCWEKNFDNYRARVNEILERKYKEAYQEAIDKVNTVSNSYNCLAGPVTNVRELWNKAKRLGA